MATSLIQRFIEGAFHVGFQGAKGTGSGLVRNPLKGKGYVNRTKGLGNDLSSGQTVGAWQDTVDSIHDSLDVLRRPTNWEDPGDVMFNGMRKTMAAAAIPLKGALGAGHLAIGAAADVAGVAANTVGAAAGIATRTVGGLTIGAGAIAGKAALKGGWALTKMAGPGVAKTTGHLAWNATKDAAYIAGGTGKFLWNTRHNPLVGTAVVGGAIAAGAALGNSNSQDRDMYGQVNPAHYPGYQAYDPQTGEYKRGLRNEVVQGAYMLQRPDSKLSAAGDKTQQHINSNGDAYKTIQDANGPMGAGFGATGDLVFALNSLRGGGIL
jgi:hypothetical protein